MPKVTPRILLFSFILVFLTSCAGSSPSYSRKEIGKVIAKICKEEFNINIKVWEEGNTIWLYAPYESVLDEEGTWNKNISTDIRRIFLSLRRVILSVDKRPEFYCFVVSDIKKIGADIYYAGYVKDLMMVELGYLPPEEFENREVFIRLPNPKALGDIEGTHIERHDITMGEFISYLVRQSLEKGFTADKVKNFFQINNIQADYDKGRLKISTDIKVKDYKAELPDPFEETKKIVRRYLEIYNPQDIVEVEIDDTIKNRAYNKRTLLEEK
jgi:hypothetical protein